MNQPTSTVKVVVKYHHVSMIIKQKKVPIFQEYKYNVMDLIIKMYLKKFVY